MQRNKALLILALLLAVSSFSFCDDDDSAAPQKSSKLKWLQDMSAGADSSSSGQSPAVAGVRGLEDVGKAPDTSIRDVAAIDRLDKVQVSKEELKKFVAEGNLK